MSITMTTRLDRYSLIHPMTLEPNPGFQRSEPRITMYQSTWSMPGNAFTAMPQLTTSSTGVGECLTQKHGSGTRAFNGQHGRGWDRWNFQRKCCGRDIYNEDGQNNYFGGTLERAEKLPTRWFLTVKLIQSQGLARSFGPVSTSRSHHDPSPAEPKPQTSGP